MNWERAKQLIASYIEALKEHVWLRWVSGIAAFIVFVAIAGAIQGEPVEETPAASSSPPSESEPKPEPKAKPRPKPEPPPRFRGQQAKIEAVFIDHLGGDPAKGLKRIRGITRRASRSYFVQMNANDITFGEDEVLRNLRPVFDDLLNEQKLRRVRILAYTDVVSVGGKESVGPFFAIECDRADNAQIDWDNVLEEGMKTICDYALLVNK